jgi:hypothetical protein
MREESSPPRNHGSVGGVGVLGARESRVQWGKTPREQHSPELLQRFPLGCTTLGRQRSEGEKPPWESCSTCDWEPL